MSSATDLRAPLLAVLGWIAASVGLSCPAWAGLLAVPFGVWVLVRRRQGRTWLAAACWLVAATATFASAAVQLAAVEQSPVHELAAQHGAVQVVAIVTSTPRRTKGRFASRVFFDARVTELVADGRRLQLRTPIQVLAPAAAVSVARGARVRMGGMLQPANDPTRAAILSARSPPVLLAPPGAVTRAANQVRRSIREAVSGSSSGPAALVPALVDGDGASLPDQTVAEFQTTGLTHLLAVSGTNLTLIVGGLLVLARLLGVRARGLVAVGAAGVAGFVLLCGPEPSVLRAAAMGAIALFGLGTSGHRRGVHWLGIAVWLLLLADPWLARSIGFALSAVATAGILVLAPGWRDALARWLPRWAAEAIAVPVAAQLVCTPLVAAVSGQVSLIAVAANLAAGPLVGPTTVLGVGGGVIGLVAMPVGRVIATPAAWGAAGIIAIAHRAADLPVPAIGWSAGVPGLTALTLGCLFAAKGLRSVFVRRSASLGLASLMTVAVLVPLPTPGWPPPGWVLVACSVGQGDALVLSVSPGAAVVVDAGPDPRAIDRCLRRLHVRQIPVVVITHFHADHVDGLSGVLHRRAVGQILTSPVADPVGGSALVHRVAAGAGVGVRDAVVGEQTDLGQLHWQVLAPIHTSYPDSESSPNDASVVLLVEVRGIRLLMMGDEERPSQADLQRTWPDLHADVLKVAHHGSSKQDVDLVTGLGARLAVISVGLDNDYGHPARSTLDLLARTGMTVRRTDLDGDVAVVVDRRGQLRTLTRSTGP